MNNFQYPRHPRKIAGNFTIEFAIVGVFFSLLIAFSSDVIINLSLRGKLDRMSYSAASLVKERTQLFSSSSDVTKQEGINAYQIVSSSLARTISGYQPANLVFSLDVFQLSDGKVSKNTAYTSSVGISCVVPTPGASLFVTTTTGRSLILYQVTLCYKTDSWYGDLMGQTFNQVHSYSVVMGR